MSVDVLSLVHRADAVQLTAAPGPALAATTVIGLTGLMLPLPTVDVAPDGVRFPFDWGVPPPGSDRVELAPVTVEAAADAAGGFAGYPLGELPTRFSDHGLVVTVPGDRRIRALTISRLKSENVELRSEGDLRAAGRRLTVSLRDPKGGWATPVVSVPPVDPRGQVPATLTGAGFANGVLTLPDVAGSVKIAVVEGGTPDAFAPKDLSVGTVTGWAAPTPVDLTLTGPDGAVLWTFPGPLPAGGRQQADVTVAVTAAVEALRKAGGPVAGALTLTSRFPAKVGFRVGAVHGDLVRALPGTTAVALAGEPVPLPLAAPLAADPPGAAVADVTVKYDGRRLADVSDPLPAPGPQRGAVVRQDPVLRVLPPQALRGDRVGRLGLVGWCPEPSALLVRIVPAPPGPAPAGAAAGTAGAGPTGPALGKPGTAKVDPAAGTGVVWVDLPEPVTVDRPVAIEVSASSGRLHWVADPDPLVRIVVLDPDPGGRPVVLADATLLTVDRPTLRTVRAALPAAAFAGTPVLASALFGTVEITDAELRYPRGSR